MGAKTSQEERVASKKKAEVEARAVAGENRSGSHTERVAVLGRRGLFIIQRDNEVY